MKNITLLILLVAFAYQAHSQEFGIGVKAGLTFSSLSGEIEMGETFGYKSGFHVGPTFTFRFTDQIGVRAELVYNQMGTSYEYEGPSYFVLRNDIDGRRNIAGEKDISYKTYLSYIDIPLQVYYRFGDVLEVFGGPSLMLLTGGTAGGRVTFSNDNLRPSPIEARLDYRYNSDDAGEGVDSGSNTHQLGRQNFEVPETLGAYYDFEDRDGRAWNTLDYGVHGGVRILFNDALYLEGRIYYGFNDVSNNDLDLRQYRPNSSELIERSNDEDRNIAFGASLGFSF